jgi:hypothetical protein
LCVGLLLAGPGLVVSILTKCPSTWPAHFAAVTTAALHSFLHQQG